MTPLSVVSCSVGMSSYIPDGFVFSPSEETLLMSYLRRRVLEQPLPWKGVIQKTLYGDLTNPWELFSDDDPWQIPVTAVDNADHKKIIYVFTKLKKVRNGDKNITRTSGCGTWHGQTGAKDIFMSGETTTKIGFKRMFTFKPGKGFVTKGNWTMHEYSLSDAGLKDIVSTDYVICKITKTESKADPKISHREIDLRDPQVLNSARCDEDLQITQVSDTTTIPPLHWYPDNAGLQEAQGQMMIMEDASGTAPSSMDYTYNNEENAWMPQELQPFIADLEEIIDFSFLDGPEFREWFSDLGEPSLQ